MKRKKKLVSASNFPYGKVSLTLLKAAKWINRNQNRIKENEYDYFDYPSYWGLPSSITSKLTSDEVDFIQDETYNWAEKHLLSK